ncbi:MAG: ribbon-helix-helix protein, CopG family [Acidobacteria bacterium]|nr:ribbon-helix-helix protein, CopG family [Acidobacteriota bacterium]
MTARKPRRRLVFFRVSDDEYERIRSMRGEVGVRSVSELARNAVQQFTALEGIQRESVPELLKTLEETVACLCEAVQELRAALEVEKRTAARAKGMHA